MRKAVALLFVLVLALALPLFAAEKQPSADLEARRKALNHLLHEQWEYTLRINPIFASIIGDKRYNDQVGDSSEKATLADLEESRKFLARFEAIATTGFPEQGTDGARSA
jgi:DNA repair photolyase